MIYGPGDNRWLEVVTSFERSAYRLEQQPIYIDDVRAGLLDDWLAGATGPPGPNDWSRFVESKVASGAEIVRVRILEDPPTPYQQWIKWYSAKNIAAGEQHHYITRAQAQKAGIDHTADFWLLDGLNVVEFPEHGSDLPFVEVDGDLHVVDWAGQNWNRAMSLVEATV